ncbi:AMIN domain-containing protein [Geobacter sp. AOG2]|uniref:AMIN domain-containing protein n=1 Tax=Geobacter sp. AOG2 TaxID=1566347 RepID=UPI001CC35965|nr:AMIN domain-containing protein [Geobacter sp. AOG2]GFE60524.1 hypothetical protein AOG2_11120 [Geobacter sp. AOG2]
MKRTLVITLFMMIIALPVVPVFAAELLDVKPVVAGNDLIVEILADIPMTYTYYKVPGQARAVVDIADADPEKVEPLIVVNKGVVSSISVDKAQIAGMVVSRVIFNLVSDADISATASADRKKLSVTFVGGKPAIDGLGKPAVPLAGSVSAPISPSDGVSAAAIPAAITKNETDPLGLDEPSTATTMSDPAAHVVDVPAPSTALPKIVPAPTASVKLEPVVPASAPHRKHTVIRAIKVGTSYVDIEANDRLEVFEQMKLTQPNRLVIDVSGATSPLNTKDIAVRRFGLKQVRIGRYSDHIRIVFDAGSSPFPNYKINPTAKGLRVSFK